MARKTFLEMRNKNDIRGFIAFWVMLVLALIVFGCATSHDFVGKSIVVLCRPRDTVQIIGSLSDRFEVMYRRKNGTSYSYMIDRKELFIIIK